MTNLMLLMGGSPEGAPSPFVGMIPFLLIFLIMYFMLIRPQQKRAQQHQDFVKSLEKGDAVVTESGMYGTIVSLDDDSVLLKVDDNVRIRFLKAKVAGRRGAVPAESKKGR